MSPSVFISCYSQDASSDLSASLLPYIAFQPEPMEYGYPTDIHMEFREQIVDALLIDFFKRKRAAPSGAALLHSCLLY